MRLPEYITKEEVRRVCGELKIRDWTKLKEPKVTPAEAKTIMKHLDSGGLKIDPEQFRAGLEVELEHGVRFKEANVTNNHPLITGKIVIAHMFETLDYYMRLDIAEIEGDLHKAIAGKNMQKITKYAKKLQAARMALGKAEAKDL
ncbi:MAG: hypothetical protein M0024_08625 [Nitrospiraceae bacterium]|nr:hypothetical protein [Nitrospiraceae bacterium]